MDVSDLAAGTTQSVGHDKPIHPLLKASAPKTAAVPFPPNVVVGSNIHSDDQGRQLCSSSEKLCNARPIAGYGFCKSHILEDPTAPFKQCEAILRGSKRCTLVVSLNQPDTRFCPLHVALEKKKEAEKHAIPAADSTPSATPHATPTQKHKEKLLKPAEPLKLLDDVTSDSDEDDTPSYYSDLDDDSDYWEDYFPKLASGHLFLSPDLQDDEEGQPTLGHPNFNLSSFLQHRSDRLLTLVKQYRLQMQVLYRAYESHAHEPAMMRARMLARLQNEQECRAHDAERRRLMMEKLIRRKHQEQQSHRKAGPEMDTTSDPLPNQPFPSPAAPRAIPHTTSDMDFSTPTSKPKAKPKTEKAKISKTIPSCTFDGCTEPSLPVTSFCWAHILNDPKQVLFVPCTYGSPDTKQVCGFPIIKHTEPPYCAVHAELTSKNVVVAEEIDEDAEDHDAESNEDVEAIE